MVSWMGHFGIFVESIDARWQQSKTSGARLNSTGATFNFGNSCYGTKIPDR